MNENQMNENRMNEKQEIQALKERIFALETKVDRLSESSKERPFLINVLVGFVVVLVLILVVIGVWEMFPF
ncbi:hypothetical protein [Paenibacillus eucommiae]|uniref:Membrane protein n=1 Tax=Paenibacillus eucommiae TaxID=1355755 RepID=A0ABS4J025_9BACL|nr:hypothetical protein [Paenibacillus eucommiae]MBP1993189.1 putative membrane protein [Paenibacillus eucommiae]